MIVDDWRAPMVALPAGRLRDDCVDLLLLVRAAHLGGRVTPEEITTHPAMNATRDSLQHHHRDPVFVDAYRTTREIGLHFQRTPCPCQRMN